MYKLCIFDFDGTLCASHDAIAYCMLSTFDHYDHPRPDESELHAAIRKSVGVCETFADLHRTGLSDAEAVEWRDTYRTIYDDGSGLARSRLFDGTADILGRLKNSGIPAIILSNKGERAVLQALDHFGLGSYFEMEVAERDGIALKPDPASYTGLIAPRYGHIAAADILMIGDAPPDLEYARNIGATSCWARYGHGDPALCLSLDPDHVIDSLHDLERIVF